MKEFEAKNERLKFGPIIFIEFVTKKICNTHKLSRSISILP